MRILSLLTSLLLTYVTTYGQDVRFTFEGDSITTPFVQDSLRGISGLEIVPTTGEWHLVSDRGWHFIFTNIRSIRDLGDGSHLKSAGKTPYWFESARYDAKGGMYFWTDEHEHVTSIQYGKAIRDSAAQTILKIPLPAPNKGLEGLAIMPSGALWVAPEAGWEGETNLNQDTITFFQYPNPLDADPVVARYKYRIDRCLFAQGEERTGGISEIVALDDRRLLILERCYDNTQKRVTANLYLATPDEITHTLRKELAFDFNRQFPGNVCNLEAMAWADESHQTLILMADDNFRVNKTLRNQVIVLKRR
ncbi:esterase-like activity of phytase family protein [Spirosoma linguale]|uniref:Phytase-like domain-containing protein n=1 Tax=Spirosoma linguale (strain ATCC 33905 / DSM 74 / LMG 10896 / Claus 1) TaxID=504472 RepID=D2QCC7_SPILD|nr:hypothetical protein Slin_0173 [Spirosoma linguale DSM 74]